MNGNASLSAQNNSARYIHCKFYKQKWWLWEWNIWKRRLFLSNFIVFGILLLLELYKHMHKYYHDNMLACCQKIGGYRTDNKCEREKTYQIFYFTLLHTHRGCIYIISDAFDALSHVFFCGSSYLLYAWQTNAKFRLNTELLTNK